jgi:hypothetical protein
MSETMDVVTELMPILIQIFLVILLIRILINIPKDF